MNASFALVLFLVINAKHTAKTDLARLVALYATGCAISQQ